MIRAVLVITVFFASTASGYAQEVLDNAAIVRLSRAGLGADVIILKIERTNGNFDTSSAALIDLKNANVSEGVIKAMLLKEPAPSEQPARQPAALRTPPEPVGVVAAAPPGEFCVKLEFYTLGTGGWSWVPSGVCASKSQLSVDDQTFALDSIVVHCIDPEHRLAIAGVSGRTDPGWRFSDQTQTYEFRGKGDEARRLYEFLAAAHPSLRHGDCTDRDIRALLKPSAKH